MSITPQDILEQEFHTRFRGFDMAEVDAFLEQVAEYFSMLIEENKQLGEQVQALQKGPPVDSRLEENLKEVIVSSREVATELKSLGQQEPAADLTGTLDEIRQSTERINTGLAALQEDGEIFNSLKEIVASVREAATRKDSTMHQEIPAGLADSLAELKQNTEKINTDLAVLKEDSETFDSLKEIVASAREAAGEKGFATHQEIPADLAGSLAEVKQNTEKINTDLAALKGDLSSLEQGREQLKTELQDMLRSHLDKIDVRLSGESPAATPPPFPVPEKEADQKAESVQDRYPSDEEQEDANRVQDRYPSDEKQEDEESVLDSRPSDEEQKDDDMQKEDDLRQEDTTHFNEADMLNEDKLRDLFASIMDDDDSPKEAETSNDMLFGGQGLVKDVHEPEVTFILEEALEEEDPGKQAGNKPDH